MTQQYPPQYPSPMPPPAPARAVATPWWKRTWALITFVVLALLIGTGIGSSTQKTKNVAGATTTQTATATVVSTAPAPPAVTQTLKPTVIKTIATRTHVVKVVYTPPPLNEFDDGLYRVGSDIPAGTYRTPGGDSCYFAILNSTDSNDISDNNNFSGPEIVTLNQGKYFDAEGGCTWARERN